MDNSVVDYVVEMRNISKTYKQNGEDLLALKPISLQIKAGEIVALVGASGAGKSTLLHIAGLLLRADTGAEHLFCGEKVHNMNEAQITGTRLKNIGFVYQFHHLLPELKAWENVAMPLWLQRKKGAKQIASSLLEQMGLAHRINHLPSELSGGEQQRVAIARALVHNPMLFLADEPTGNLDPNTALIVENIMRDNLRKNNKAALIVTHNLAMAQRMDRIISLVY
jgi:lipoprotein-releasing system ATP-binding protein